MPTRSTTTATSAPAISVVRRPRATSSSPGRLKDIIIRKGENISAKELEDMLFRHPKVGDVAVMGLPDAASGERACAVVATATGTEPIGFDEMTEYLLAEGLMVQKLPEQLEILDTIPRNPSGQDPQARAA
jgi:cyclohexanecarboxylate-CoA ligase